MWSLNPKSIRVKAGSVMTCFLTLMTLLELIVITAFIVIFVGFALYELDRDALLAQAQSYGLLKACSIGQCKIATVGDSITAGSLSTDNNGYRKYLYFGLEARYPCVKMIGQIQSGNMTNNWCDGYPGAPISLITERSNRTFLELPDIVLVHVATNDLMGNDPEFVKEAPKRLTTLLDSIFEHSPDSAVLVAQNIPSWGFYSQLHSMIEAYNAKIPEVVAAQAAQGRKCMIVDHNSGFREEDLIDGVHPKDDGYAIMAQRWLDGIASAQHIGWVRCKMRYSA